MPECLLDRFQVAEERDERLRLPHPKALHGRIKDALHGYAGVFGLETIRGDLCKTSAEKRPRLFPCSSRLPEFPPAIGVCDPPAIAALEDSTLTGHRSALP